MIAGTDDDLPPTHQNRISRGGGGGGGGRLAGNGRSAVGSIPYPRMYGEIDMEAQIHQLEQEAYSSVLRAFKAQADAITWVFFLFVSNVMFLKFLLGLSDFYACLTLFFFFFFLCSKKVYFYI